MSYEESIRKDYFKYLYNIVCDGKVHDGISFEKVLSTLHDIEFTYILLDDENRAKDGIYLRYKYSYIMGDETLKQYLIGPCSVLELMVGMVLRMEDIMCNNDYGNRTGQWFWLMMRNLGIGMMDDEIFDEKYVREKIRCFLNRDYAPDGTGGLFILSDSNEDVRDLDLWVQLNWFLNYFE